MQVMGAAKGRKMGHGLPAEGKNMAGAGANFF
jgi:hypothetical protein